MWDLTGHVRKRTLWSQVEADFRTNLSKLKQDADRKGVPLVVQAMNYAGGHMSQHCCKLSALTGPPYVDSWNKVMHKTAKELGIEFIDTSPVTKPLWDSSPDWSHPSEQLKQALSLFVTTELVRIFRASPRTDFTIKFIK